MLSTELAKDIKRATGVEHEIPKAIFKNMETFACNDRSFIADLWGFESDSD